MFFILGQYCVSQDDSFLKKVVVKNIVNQKEIANYYRVSRDSLMLIPSKLLYEACKYEFCLLNSSDTVGTVREFGVKNCKDGKSGTGMLSLRVLASSYCDSCIEIKVIYRAPGSREVEYKKGAKIKPKYPYRIYIVSKKEVLNAHEFSNDFTGEYYKWLGDEY